MSIQDKLNELKPYVFGIRLVSDNSIVDTILKPTWNKDAIHDENIEHKLMNADKNYYIFFAKNNIGIDYVLKYVESIINFNIENEKKVALYDTYKIKLKDFFASHDLIELQNLEFTINSVVNEQPQESIID